MSRNSLSIHVSTMITVLFVSLSGCATTQPRDSDTERDALQTINRPIFKFNLALDKAIIKPVATGYSYVVPAPVRSVFGNFFTNLMAPIDIVNNVLQGKVGSGVSDTGRFLVNSTLGIGGLFDPATSMGLSRHQEDLGQTLAVWGVGQGPFMVLPLLGPTTLRDAVGWIPDSQLHPLNYIDDNSTRDKLLLLRTLNKRAQALRNDWTPEQDQDLYVLTRDFYLQRRLFMIYDGAVPVDETSDNEL